MKLWKKAVIAIGAAALLCGAFLLGRGSAGWLGEKAPRWDEVVLMHAEIVDRDGTFFHVNGLDCNDVNGQGECTFSVTEDTVLEWRYTPITLEDFKAGDKVSVTYTGPVMLSEPAQLTQVLRIQLLEDEK